MHSQSAEACIKLALDLIRTILVSHIRRVHDVSLEMSADLHVSILHECEKVVSGITALCMNLCVRMYMCV
jgi:hypothetical protein